MLSTRRTKGWHGKAPDAVARAWYEGDPVSRARTDLLRQIPLRRDRHGGHGDDERWLVQVQLMIVVIVGDEAAQ